MEIKKLTGTNWNPFGISLQSADDQYYQDAATICVYAFRHSLRWRIPQIIQPFRIRHPASSWDAATVARMGRNWYEEIHQCEYGFRLSDGFVQVFLGPQTMDSKTTKNWCFHLPWTQWRHVRFSLYGLAGEHFWTQLDRNNIRGISRFAAQREQEKTVPSAQFKFSDYDSQEIEATTHIQEREYRRGEKWCKWLSLFYAPKVHRALEMKFSKEVGREKGSWKGGTMGHSIEMLPGELHDAAFKRYCAANNLTNPIRL